jgi:hypothetical protein
MIGSLEWFFGWAGLTIVYRKFYVYFYKIVLSMSSRCLRHLSRRDEQSRKSRGVLATASAMEGVCVGV